MNKKVWLTLALFFWGGSSGVLFVQESATPEKVRMIAWEHH